MSLVGELSSSSTTGTGFFSSTSPLTSDSGINNNEKKKTDPYGQINFNACASGCLHEVGSGIVRTLIVFIFFIVGTFIAALDWSFNVWFKAKSEGRINLIEKWGIAGGTIFQTFVFLVLVIITIAIEIKKHGLVEEKIIQRLLMKLFPKLRAIARNKSNSIESKSLLSNHTKNAKKEVVKNIFTKKHDIYVGSILLTIAQIFLYLSTSNFWGVMGVFPFLIALPLRAMNVDVEKMKYFQEYSTLPTHFFANDYIVLDLSIILGAFLSATVTGTFGKGNYRPNWKVYGSAIIAGLLLGFGSRWAYGCNVGAWTSPSIAASVSGYVWFAGGLLGNIVGVICRPYVGLKN